MPAFNAAPFIGAALNSIAVQSRGEIEVIIADAQSEDATLEVVERHAHPGVSVKVVTADFASAPSVVRNRALGEATGDLVGFLDADDLWPPGKLDRQFAYLASHPNIGMVTGYVRYFEIADHTGLCPAAGSRTEDVFHVHLGASIYRRTAIQQLGPFDPSLRYAEDVDLMLRLRESALGFAILRSVELYYRRHPASLTAQGGSQMHSDFRRAALKSLQRRRAAGTLDIPLPEFSSFLV